jgi:dsDNA-specific endonuclease/ATPase MutS2
MLPIGVVWTAASAFYSLFVKPVRDTGNFIEPLRKKSIADDAFNRAIDAVGMIDELLSCHAFARQLPHATVLPKVTDADHHAFEATGLKNPVLANSKTEVVPNDVCMNGARLTFISGTNSGGKTTICKSIVHNHSLVDRFMEAQKGQCFMVAFNGEDPTYRIIRGISRVSHADRVAKKIGFSEQDRRQYMQAKGYI